ncbi:MAG: zinc-binding dehydrogenase [Planctomycetes bacterium]|nr:zinc-binding dehydrogenase [Planctomycetota bacterium]
MIVPGQLRLEEVPVPELGREDLLVRVRVALTGGTDLKTYRRGHPLFPLPTPMGHEFAGVVEAVGPDVSGFVPGDRIAAVHSGPCNACFYCERGQENLCESLVRTMVLGAFSEFVRIPGFIVRQNAFPMPDSMGFEEAAFLEPLSCVVHGMTHLDLRSVRTAVVVGAGPIGLLYAQLLKREGVERVVILGRRPVRLAAARRIGADVVVDAGSTDGEAAIKELTGGHGADVVVECTGRPEVWEASSRIVRNGGTVLLYGGCKAGTQVNFDAYKLHYGAITLKGAFHYRPADVRRAFGLLVERALDLRPLLTGECRLRELEGAFQDLMLGEGLKIAVVP